MLVEQDVLREAHSSCILEFVKDKGDSKCKYCKKPLVSVEDIINEAHADCHEFYDLFKDGKHYPKLGIDYSNTGEVTGLLLTPDSLKSPLAHIPDYIFQLTELERLSIIEYKFQLSIPHSICNLRKLQLLEISGKLTSVPEFIGDLKSIISLNLSGNHLTKLPDSLSNLKNLTFLGIGGNQFETIPKVVFELPKLQTLILAHNKGSGQGHTKKNLYEQLPQPLPIPNLKIF